MADEEHELAERMQLAGWTAQSGNAAGAAEKAAAVAAERSLVLGPNHPETLGARSNLATSTGAAGNLAGARELFAELLVDQTRALGPTHRYILICGTSSRG
ncbi:tetratricopeptide repeat protein [Amycolatopsis sp. FDAARGOS 1241]|uniref:tetratricopeptide repeat protein n=1 Tax=Amycolatopsis sp. FDAARGOS 1241 TaxID=2778070 RepID=UPI00194EBBDB|nr:tetratricopeptide repeat protein [Amycolatopsis sp. FDAARGOS 1241]QRP48482.1 tetratricopeptide repeat protein [Amycolatopsis sp. FDAARGOS 1241]